MSKELLEIENLKTYFYTWAGVVKAVDGVSLKIKEGETLGLVGESGSGKSVTALSILRIVPRPGRVLEGRIWYKGENLLEKKESEMQKIRGKEISYVFQDPATSLNPVFSIANQLVEIIKRHQTVTKQNAVEKALERLLTVTNRLPKQVTKQKLTKKTLEIARAKLAGKPRPITEQEALEKALELFKLVEIPDPQIKIHNYPHQLSGGMKQRIALARALSCQPSLLLADEPTTALDVTIQAQILALLKNLKQKLGMAMILITHDMGVVAGVADRITVMYAGRVCESASTKTIFHNPLHPYTRALLEAVPSLALKREQLKVIPGAIPNLIEPPTGCRFHPRCEFAKEQVCTLKVPALLEVEPEHFVACARAMEIEPESPLRSRNK